MNVTPLESFPPPASWDDWTELDAKAWPKKLPRNYQLIPTTCFNCEAACGLVAYVDKKSSTIRKLEGNPYHPGSRGRNCAKGPATINQVNDPDRILYPMKRTGARGSGEFERTTWDEVLDSLAARIRKAIQEKRLTEVMYHVGRPGADGYMDRVLQSWGVDGHNSHTNVCSASARLGYTLVCGHDRPSPDYSKAKFILLISAHLETGHYFNPHAQRIMEAKMQGAKIATCDIRLSNTASMSDYWLAPRPGTEAFLLLGFLHVLLHRDLFDRDFVVRWVDWRGWLRQHGHEGGKFEEFVQRMKETYAHADPAAVAREPGVDEETIIEGAKEIGRAGSAFSSHIWRNTASGNEGGWEVARCLQVLNSMVGAVGTIGGTNPNGWNKFVAAPFSKPSPQEVWSELLYPREWPLAHHELSFILPHLLKTGRGKIDTYFTRVYNPVWTNPDGLSWIEALRDEAMVGMHAALTPVWNETALWADYVLPMGVATERHDLMSQETHAAQWISFRQPVMRRYLEKQGKKVDWTYEANPGEVWEEDEFWIALSWRIDPDGELGIRKHFESPYRPGRCITIDEYYRWIFENSVPGLPEAAAEAGLEPLEYMRERGAFLVKDNIYQNYQSALGKDDLDNVELDEVENVIRKDDKIIGALVDGKACVGFPTPSRRLELTSEVLGEWAWPEFQDAGYIPSHVHESRLDRDKNEFPLISTFRLPTLIHTRSANSKWLTELSNSNPVWIHPRDAERLGVATGDLVRVSSRIGYYVNKAWVTEGIRPGVIACSHHMGRFRQRGVAQGVNRWQQHESDIQELGEGRYKIERTASVSAFDSADPDSRRVWWRDGGVHQNFIFPVQPDPVSGMHCWHQKVTLNKAEPGDRYGDTEVDTGKSMAVFEEWLARTRPAAGELRRPLHFKRVLRPTEAAFRLGR
ncbi:MAG: molybdopterin dinucleotide binding domain-containing protein [Planctomycetota bacterium]